MGIATYNVWYSATYERIFDMANWSEFSSDLDKKIVCVFAWMPQAIMNIHHSGKGKNLVTKASIYDPIKVYQVFEELKSVAKYFKDKNLTDTDLDDSLVKNRICKLCNPLFSILGSVATSKFLHFSYPYFFIMWDNSLRKKKQCKNSQDGYWEYLKKAQKALKNKRIIKLAKKEYKFNPVRGLDVYWMKTK